MMRDRKGIVATANNAILDLDTGRRQYAASTQQGSNEMKRTPMAGRYLKAAAANAT